MNRANIHQTDIIKQDARIGYVVKKGFSLNHLIHNLIREYGTYRDGSYDVDVYDFDLTDKKLLISHFEAASEYEWACKYPSRVEALFQEHAKHIQELINDECQGVYQDDMEEMRSYR